MCYASHVLCPIPQNDGRSLLYFLLQNRIRLIEKMLSLKTRGVPFLLRGYPKLIIQLVLDLKIRLRICSALNLGIIFPKDILQSL